MKVIYAPLNPVSSAGGTLSVLFLLLVLVSPLSCSCNGDNGSHDKRKHDQHTQPIITQLEWGKVQIRLPDGTVSATTDEQSKDWVIVPEGCKPWNFKQFGYKSGPKIVHQSSRGPGVLPYAVEGLLEYAKNNLEVVIVSKGMTDSLGVHESTKTRLEELKAAGTIQEYIICNSKEVPKHHNAFVAQGRRVGTLLHSTC